MRQTNGDSEGQHVKLSPFGRCRYSPLAVLEALKAFLRLRSWSQTGTLLAMETLAPEDLEHIAAHQDLRELLQAFGRLRQR